MSKFLSRALISLDCGIQNSPCLFLYPAEPFFKLFPQFQSYFQGTITDAALINSLSVLNLGKQYVTISDKGCKAVRIEKEISISQLERMAISDVAVTNREKGISEANEICKNYRREGLFFDEILEKAKAGGKV